MKYINHLCSFLAVARLVSAAPTASSELPAVPEVDDIANQMILYEGDEDELLGRSLANPLEPRMVCRRMGRVIMRIGTSAAVAAFVHVGTDYASYVCEQENAAECVKYVGYVQHGLDGLFVVLGFVSGAIGLNNNNYQQSFDSPAKRDIAESSMPDWNLLDQVLRNDGGWTYDSMDTVDLANITINKRDSDPNLVHRTIARNVEIDEEGNTSDFGFSFYDNGDVNMQIGGDSGSLPSGNEGGSDLNKRFNGAGFKISATTRVRSRLTRAHQTKMAYFMAQDWASDANSMKMSDYIGLVKTDHQANFYFRIIPETKGFGLNYESVNVCGQLAQFL
ncbi:hypothetical protein N7481_003426 [Penicillium waksmanii]|uniref:uncharacterized protein n=1 Tax=Penicillium waksmanii TaxID=69791 RepID=UPI00254805F5|nr:uncharacterized protein N7481_003426 [Penicillium waksmanii]KAJ5988216.1 hypothetical protein N7481_003426 [Penicillium waksmanii]